MQAEPVKANLKFLANVDEPLIYIPSKGGGDETELVGNFTMHEVSIHNGRHDKQSSSLDVEGFKLVSQETEVEDFYDEVQVESVFHEEVKA
ncbi:MAG: methyltransferase, partial [Woeseiaceae bacterium]